MKLGTLRLHITVSWNSKLMIVSSTEAVSIARVDTRLLLVSDIRPHEPVPQISVRSLRRNRPVLDIRHQHVKSAGKPAAQH